MAAAAARLLDALGEDFAAAGFVRSRFAGDWDTKSLTVWQGSLHDWTAQQFPKSDCLVFVGACGIAVRAIAPFVADKLHDPAVVVIDEKGRFCIPLLSGHVGRANELAGYFAKILGALPIITTATDLNGLFAVDVFAQKNELVLTDRAKAKAISAALLSGQKAALFSDFPIRGKLPEGATMIGQNAGDWRICISFCNPDRPDTLWLPPRRLVLGIGCRRGVLEKTIEAFVSAALQKAGVPLEAVRAGLLDRFKKGRSGAAWFLPKPSPADDDLFRRPVDGGAGDLFSLRFCQTGDRGGQRLRACGSAGRRRRGAAAAKTGGQRRDGGAGSREGNYLVLFGSRLK